MRADSRMGAGVPAAGRARRRLMAIVLGCALAAPALAQRPDLTPWEPELEPPLKPTVIFTYSFAGSDPDHFAVAVNTLGKAAYESRGVAPISGDERQPHIVKFTMSDKNRDRIFELLKKLNHFEGNFDYRRRRIADLGTKTLAYRDGIRRVETSFNYSQNRDIQELTHLFLNISTTLEFGRRLRHLRRFDRLGLDAELKAMERAAEENRLAELQVVAPILRELAADRALMRVVRERAQRIAQQVEERPESAPPATF